mgnify:CR=1 FL=1
MEKEPFYNEPNNEGNYSKYSIPEESVDKGKNQDTEDIAENREKKEDEKIVNSEKDNNTKEEISTNAESISNVTKHIDISDLLGGVDGAELLKPNEKDREYMRAYKRIQLGIDPNEPAFVITPRQLFAIEKILPEFTEKVAKELGLSGNVGGWEVGPINSILAKSLSAESSKYSTWIAEEIAKTEKNNLLVCDLCAGSGTTSAKIYTEAKKQGKNIQIHSIDKSVESLSISLLLCVSQDIPCILINGSKELGQIPDNFNGVVLIYSDAQTYMSDLDENIKYDNITSESGISYFPREVHKKVLEDSKKHLNDNATIYLSSLNPDLTVKLDMLFLAREVLLGGRARKYEKRINMGAKPYIVSEDQRIRKIMSIEAGREYDFMNYLLKHDQSSLLGYMRAVMNITKAAKDLHKVYQSPVNKVHHDVIDVYDVSEEDIEKYPTDYGSPADVIKIKL